MVFGLNNVHVPEIAKYFNEVASAVDCKQQKDPEEIISGHDSANAKNKIGTDPHASPLNSAFVL